jgi:hypothetical protein
MSQQKIGIIQSRGLGDIIIALPIAKEYTRRGYEVYWPVCEPFYQQMVRVAPWVRWLSVPVDQYGQFFYENPHKQLQALGVTEELWLYQYLSSHPDRTNKSHFAQFKFDQYKYAAAEVPFRNKWQLAECLELDPAAQDSLYNTVVKQERYMVYQNHASDMSYDIDLSIIEPGVQCIELTELAGYSVFDWIKVLAGAETIILIDSVFANLIDQLDLNPAADKYYMRKWNRRVDGNPVLLGAWTFVDIADPEGMQVQSLADTGLKDPAAQAQAAQQNPPTKDKPEQAGRVNGGAGQTYTPYGQTANTQNAAQRLQASLGLRR